MSRRSPQWPEVRAKFLAANPTCAACGGNKELEVHHILPFHIDPTRELDDTNLITLCERPGHDCHFTWGHFHDWYKWNPDVIEMAAQYMGKEQAAP